MKRDQLVFATACLLSASPVAASAVRDVTLENLVQTSEFIFRGTLSKAEVTLDGDDSPWTYYTFTNVEPIAGSTDATEFSLRCYGGPRGDGTEAVALGTPHYKVGDEVVVFFDEDDQLCQVAAWERGSLRVVAAPDGGKKVTTDDGRLVEGIRGNDFEVSQQPDWLPGKRARRARVVEKNGHPTLVDLGVAKPSRGGAPAQDFLTNLRSFVNSRGKKFQKVSSRRAKIGAPVHASSRPTTNRE